MSASRFYFLLSFVVCLRPYLINLFVRPEVVDAMESSGDAIVFSKEDGMCDGKRWVLVAAAVACAEARELGRRPTVLLLVALRQRLVIALSQVRVVQSAHAKIKNLVPSITRSIHLCISYFLGGVQQIIKNPVWSVF
jgi:hypothetical protein